jgi:ATPase family AAA domain-containing protein 3A/B
LIQVAKDTDGFSGREISKLAIAWQAAAFGTDDAILSGEMMKTVVKEFMQSKDQKRAWLSPQEVENLTKST